MDSTVFPGKTGGDDWAGNAGLDGGSTPLPDASLVLGSERGFFLVSWFGLGVTFFFVSAAVCAMLKDMVRK